jgi:predicted nuclease of predicted toxin-antitoxin system
LVFLVDAQLRPSLAEALRLAGCQAVHVIDLGLLAAADQQIWDEAISRSAVLVTKDRDFPFAGPHGTMVQRSCG